MEILKTVLSDLLYLVLTVAVPVLLKYAISFLKARIDNAQELVDNEVINQAIDFVQNIVEQIVIEVNQTYVDELKKEGKFDEAAAQMAYDAALTKSKELLNESYQMILEDLFGNLDDYLKVLIETCVNKNKLKV